jgi:IS5 family transposase
MNPYLTEALAEQRIADWRREAAASRRAAAAREVGGPAAIGTLAHRAGRLIRLLAGRRYRQIELVWPDGVCSVVPARSDDPARPMAASRR